MPPVPVKHFWLTCTNCTFEISPKWLNNIETGNMAEKPKDHHDQSQMHQSKSNNTAGKDTQPSENTAEQTKPEHVLPGNKYFILQTGVTLNCHVNFIVLLKQKIRSLQKVNTVDECDFILAFCPVATRAGTDIEGAEKKLHATSDQGLLQCRKNSDAIEHVHKQIKPKVQILSLAFGANFNRKLEEPFSTQKLSGNQKPQNPPEYSEAVDKTLQENKELEDFKKEIAEMKLPKNNELIIATELRLMLLGGEESEKTAAKNIILGREEMNQAAASTTTATQLIAGTKVLVVDTPDLFSPINSLEELSHTVESQAFLLVIPVKYSEDKVLSEDETQKTLMKLEEIFGTRCWRNTMILFTVSDELQKKKIEGFIQSEDQEVQRLLEKCGNRFHCLNINESGDGSQVSELLEKIDKMVEGNRNGSQINRIIRNMEMERHAKDVWIRKMQSQIQKVLGKYEQIDKEYENDLKNLDTDEAYDKKQQRSLREIVSHLKNQNKLKKEIAEQMKMIYDRITEQEQNKQFIKAILSENQQTIWLSLPDGQTKTLEKYNELRQLEEKFLEMLGKLAA
ncbi:girdin-like isoform X4 [Hemibagrus wyckioides]|uniref:girdin-like isoform X4 n=1 Tax=Hemibagrus wyckioides TaxID=337641 RepID=UPI00266BB4A8|nr:girdin-like isoform X4 [Hemibagrus wyckioides]